MAAGQINGSTGDDVVVGAPYWDGPSENDLGKVFLYLGATGTPDSTADWTYTGPQSNDRLGWSLAISDVNDQSPRVDDIVMGVPYGHSNGSSPEDGKVYIFHGVNGSLPAASPNTTLTGSPANTRFGWSVAGLRDINADGIQEIIVGVPYYTNSHNAEGRVYVYRGASSGLNTSVYWTAEPDQADAHFGWSVAGGDLDGDNKGDVIVGAPDYDYVSSDVGSAWVWFSDSSSPTVFGSDGTGSNKDWLSVSTTASAHYGKSVGYAKYYQFGSTPAVLVGAPDEGNGNANVWKY